MDSVTRLTQDGKGYVMKLIDSRRAFSRNKFCLDDYGITGKHFERMVRTMDSAKVHELKTDPEAYEAIVVGHKTNTVRLDDRTYIEGDYIIFRRTKYTGDQMKLKGNEYPLIYSGLSTLCKITHVHEGPGMAEGWVVCSIKILDRFPGRVC